MRKLHQVIKVSRKARIKDDPSLTHRDEGDSVNTLERLLETQSRSSNSQPQQITIEEISSIVAERRNLLGASKHDLKQHIESQEAEQQYTQQQLPAELEPIEEQQHSRSNTSQLPNQSTIANSHKSRASRVNFPESRFIRKDYKQICRDELKQLRDRRLLLEAKNKDLTYQQTKNVQRVWQQQLAVGVIDPLREQLQTMRRQLLHSKVSAAVKSHLSLALRRIFTRVLMMELRVEYHTQKILKAISLRLLRMAFEAWSQQAEQKQIKRSVMANLRQRITQFKAEGRQI